jgi:hypothetical protein
MSHKIRSKKLKYFIRKKKAKLSLCLINSAPRHEDICGSGGIAPPFLVSALVGGVW